jgi:hypothetical protein
LSPLYDVVTTYDYLQYLQYDYLQYLQYDYLQYLQYDYLQYLQYDYLQYLFSARTITVNSSLQCVDWSERSQLIATGSSDKYIRSY